MAKKHLVRLEDLNKDGTYNGNMSIIQSLLQHKPEGFDEGIPTTLTDFPHEQEWVMDMINANEICDLAIHLTDEGIEKMSWSEFVEAIEAPELIQYLKERRLYINEETNIEEDI